MDQVKRCLISGLLASILLAMPHHIYAQPDDSSEPLSPSARSIGISPVSFMHERLRIEADFLSAKKFGLQVIYTHGLDDNGSSIGIMPRYYISRFGGDYSDVEGGIFLGLYGSTGDLHEVALDLLSSNEFYNYYIKKKETIAPIMGFKFIWVDYVHLDLFYGLGYGYVTDRSHKYITLWLPVNISLGLSIPLTR